MNGIISFTLFILALLTARGLLSLYFKTSSSKARYLCFLALFALYSGLLIFYLWECQSFLTFPVVSTEALLKQIVPLILIFNFTVLFIISIFFFFIRKKRKLTNREKMQLHSL